QGVLPHIPSADAYFTVVYIPEPGNQVAERRFAGTGWPHDGSGGFIRDNEGRVLQNRSTAVGEIYMVEYNVVGFRVKFRAVLIHLRDPVHLIGVVDGTSHQTQSGHAAACGLDLGENQ